MPADFAAIAQSLDEIDGRGAVWLDRANRRAAWRSALRHAAPVVPLVPFIALLAGWAVAIRLDAQLAATLIVSGGAVLALYWRERRRRPQPARAGLALYDARLGLKDRLRMADEFLGKRDASGFYAAALDEAAPFVAQARAAHLAADPVAPMPRRRIALWVALALVLTAAALLVQHRFAPGAPRPLTAPAQRALAALGIGKAAVVDPARDPASPAERSAPPDATRVASERGMAASADRARAAQAAASAAGAGAGAGTAARGASDRQPGANAPSGDGSNTRAAGNAAGGQTADPRSGAPHPPAGAGDRAGQPGPAAAPAPGAASASDAAAAREVAANSRTDGSTTPPPPAAPANSAAQPNPMRGQGASGPGNGRQNRSQQGSAGQSQDSSQGKGNGTQERRPGQDALKSAHGALSLMLAVPMQDRLGGRASDGTVTSTIQHGAPHRSAAGAVTAEPRGAASGDAGRLAHRAATPQEKRLLARYFRPVSTGS